MSCEHHVDKRESWIDGSVYECSCGHYFTVEDLINERHFLREALIRLRDCDWVISLPDRMDAVRNIARKALESGNTATGDAKED